MYYNDEESADVFTGRYIIIIIINLSVGKTVIVARAFFRKICLFFYQTILFCIYYYTDKKYKKK